MVEAALTGHLIHIGCAKAGSTFLQRWFQDHPDFAYTSGGLGGYSGVFAIAAEAVAMREARWRVTSCEDLSAPQADVGSLVVDYERAMRGSWSERQDAARRLLAQLFPDAHILIVTRGFRAMILSSYSQYVRSGGAEDLETLNRGSRDNHPWNYDGLIQGYRDTFGPDRVIVLPYELLRDDRSAFTAFIEARLGVANFPPVRDTMNASLLPIELRWYPRLSRALGRLPVGAAVKRRLRQSYFAAVDKGRLTWLVRILQRLRPAPPVGADLIGDDVLEDLRGCAELLQEIPNYNAYGADYLFRSETTNDLPAP